MTQGKCQANTSPREVGPCPPNSATASAACGPLTSPSSGTASTRSNEETAMKKLLPFLVGLCVTAGLPASAAAADPRPNVLYIMADDHAAHAISAYGSKVNRTPNIDRLAKEGMRLT